MRYQFVKKDIEEVVQGDAFERTFQFTTSYDFTGKTVLCQVRRSDGDPELILEFKAEDSTLEVDAIQKTITLLQSAEAMQAIMAGQYAYDIKSFEIQGQDDQRIMKGKFIVISTATR